jgi:endonuclease/exonuclease/phosphatase family metal-dependent hydrolase
VYLRINSFKEKLRRIFNPDEWMIRLLRLSVIKVRSNLPGAVIIQIDGLSHTEFTSALHKGEMPKLAGLLKKEGYSQRVHYSGLPSCTPAVQGNLFYGVKSCVPAFSFKDKKSGKVFNMFMPQNAAEIEKRVMEKGVPLLKDGSSYGNIFTGGASEAHFCVSAIGWGTLLSAANPFAIIIFTAMHILVILRAALLTAVEFILAVFDSIRGFISGKNIFSEIKYIPFRVIACVIEREVLRAGAKIDITRGMPVIHINLAGYDEQSHHRGPGSKFAHWTLRGIDDVIGNIWKTAKMSIRREYDLFIYSDHGQEETINYNSLHGRSVQEAVNEVLKEEIQHKNIEMEIIPEGHSWRAGMMRNGQNIEKAETAKEQKKENVPVITALGPLGYIYPAGRLSMKQKTWVAGALVKNAKIPIVVVSAGSRKAFAWNNEGKFVLPRDASKILGKTHPFLRQASVDLVKLSRHKDAGEIMILGYKPEGKSVTFFSERGSHAGPGAHETAGFAMIPPGVRAGNEKIFHTGKLREAVLSVLKREDRAGPGIEKNISGTGKDLNLKIMSYNIHACRGMDGKVKPERIAEIIALHAPDIIAIQEADADSTMHQAKTIAAILSMNYYFHSSVLLKTGQHGNAILSRYDMKLVKRGPLPSLSESRLLEKRGAIWVEVNVRGKKIQVLNTHLSLFPAERMLQAKELLGPLWMGNKACKKPVILCGDFNSTLNSRVSRSIGEKFHSIHFHAKGFKHLKTFPSYFPLGLLDHIFLSNGVMAVKIETPGTKLEKMASDHLPLIAEVKMTAK